MAASIPGVEIFSWKSAYVVFFHMQNLNFRGAPEFERTGFVLISRRTEAKMILGYNFWVLSLTFHFSIVGFFQVSQLVDWLEKKCTKCLSHSGLTENCQRQLQHSATKLVLLAQREIMSRTISGDEFGQMTTVGTLTTTTHFHAASQNKMVFHS